MTKTGALFFSLLLACSTASAVEVLQDEATVASSVTGSRSLTQDGVGLGDFRTAHSEASYSHRFALHPKFNFVSGLAYRRTEFLIHSPWVPDLGETLHARLSCEILVTPRTWLFVNAQPGVYSDGDWTPDDFNVPTSVQFNFLQRPGLRWFAAVSVDPFRTAPVLPFGGVIWRVNAKWNLRLLLPAARVEYRALFTPEKTLDLHLGVAGNSGTYRLSQKFAAQSPRPSLSGDRFSYQETAVDAGATWMQRGWSLQLSAGWQFRRRLQFERANVELESDGVPFLALRISRRF